ncbi:MAG TPA: HlyC/CorC family transporter [Gammaproteobacteria bacterium]|nr:HlyC/CorC family transporter [Gammaproteobacteria bacterium]MDP7297089.1 HlyC/CorC family transporter [Gammaproteobacteria bacterium]MDP7659983.1 HlyC/CorC family transporter [Gammaproteobacteria bacterium]HJP38519.1 HlyC/CorC family transporter [Gammaproteobacteria bacterium]
MGDDIPPGALYGLLIFLLICSAFFSGTETALMTLNRYRLRHKAKSGHRGAILAENLLRKPDRLISLILICNNLVNVFAVQLVTIIALRLGSPFWLAASGFIFTIVLLIFAEVTPKTLAALQPERVALPAAFIYFPLARLLAPFVWLINLFANGLLRLIGININDADQDHLTVEELRTLVTEAGALLPRKRHRMLVGILELQDITVDDIMIPHNEIVGIDLNNEWDEILSTIRNSAYTRLPVFKDSIDDVIGILHMKQLVQSAGLEHLNKALLKNLVQDAYFVPEGTPLNKQIVQFQRARQRTAFIVDEYGDIQGIVTLEDILEEIIGEFTSEPISTHADVRTDDKSGYVVKGSANIRALNRMMNWRLPTNGPKTLNGLILETLEAIPKQGTGLVLNDYPIEILKTTDSVVQSVRINSPSPPPSPPPG